MGGEFSTIRDMGIAVEDFDWCLDIVDMWMLHFSAHLMENVNII
jgi:hypothetical protein